MHRADFERELMAVCKDQGIGVIPYSPLAGGFLTGKYREGVPEGSRGQQNDTIKRYANSESGKNVIAKLDEIGKAHNKTVGQTALAWMLTNPVMTAPIIGANTVEQLNNLLGAAGYRLGEDDMKALNDASKKE